MYAKNSAGSRPRGRFGGVEYTGTEPDAAASCAKIVAAGQSPLSETNPDPGFHFCFRTSGGRIGWLNCNDYADSGAIAANYVVFDYRLFS